MIDFGTLFGNIGTALLGLWSPIIAMLVAIFSALGAGGAQ